MTWSMNKHDLMNRADRTWTASGSCEATQGQKCFDLGVAGWAFVVSLFLLPAILLFLFCYSVKLSRRPCNLQTISILFGPCAISSHLVHNTAISMPQRGPVCFCFSVYPSKGPLSTPGCKCEWDIAPRLLSLLFCSVLFSLHPHPPTQPLSSWPTSTQKKTKAAWITLLSC